jgi:hypothetical protein
MQSKQMLDAIVVIEKVIPDIAVIEIFDCLTNLKDGGSLDSFS